MATDNPLQATPLYHGTRDASARIILRDGFRRSRSRSYTGTGICLSESLTVAYEYGMYERGGCILEARLAPHARWADGFGDTTPSRDGWDANFEASGLDAVRLQRRGPGLRQHLVEPGGQRPESHPVSRSPPGVDGASATHDGPHAVDEGLTVPLDQHLLDRITRDDRGALCEVAHLLRRAERAWHRIESGKQCELNAMHHDDGSFALCLRRALQAADDLVDATGKAE